MIDNNKSIWNISSKEDIKKLQDFIAMAKSTPRNELSTVVIGQILATLEEFSAELVISSKKG